VKTANKTRKKMQYKIREECKLQNALSNVEHWETRFIRTRTF